MKIGNKIIFAKTNTALSDQISISSYLPTDLPWKRLTLLGMNRASVIEMKVWPNDNPVTLSCFVSRRFDRPGDRTGTTSPAADGDPD